MSYPDGTLSEDEVLVLVDELLQFFKEKNLTWIASVYLLRKTRTYMGDSYREIKNFLEKT